MSDKYTFESGLNLNFCPSSDFESLNDADSEHSNTILARNALRLLMMGWSESWTTLITWSTFKAVFISRDPALLKEFRLAFQHGFNYLFTQLKGKEFTKDQQEQIQLFISNCLSVFPYSDPTPYESITYPQFIDNEWTMVEHNVVPIELTNSSGFERFFLEDNDRVYAYGLEPILNEKAKSRIIFMGTTYPAGQGFIPQVSTDLKCFETVGTSLYLGGKERIDKWLSKQLGLVDVCGVSLGGSLSLLLAIDKGDKLSRVDAMNPAGLYEYPAGENPLDHWDELANKPKVVVQAQADDPVSALGTWKEDWDVIKIKPPVDKKGPNGFSDHFLNYAGFADTRFTYVDVKEENSKRKDRNFWLYTVGRSILYYPIIVPFRYVIRPVINFLWEKKSYLTVGAAPFIILAVLVLMGLLPSLIPMAALFASAFTLIGFLAVFTFKQGSSNYNNEFQEALNYPKQYDPTLTRNEEMDLYNKDNTVDVVLTHEQAHTYYQIIRSLKNKSKIPVDEHNEKQIGTMSKQAFLSAGLCEDTVHDQIVLHKTKAKAVHIRNTLNLASLGLEESTLQNELIENSRRYSIGKPGI